MKEVGRSSKRVCWLVQGTRALLITDDFWLL